MTHLSFLAATALPLPPARGQCMTCSRTHHSITATATVLHMRPTGILAPRRPLPPPCRLPAWPWPPSRFSSCCTRCGCTAGGARRCCSGRRCATMTSGGPCCSQERSSASSLRHMRWRSRRCEGRTLWASAQGMFPARGYRHRAGRTPCTARLAAGCMCVPWRPGRP